MNPGHAPRRGQIQWFRGAGGLLDMRSEGRLIESLRKLFPSFSLDGCSMQECKKEGYRMSWRMYEYMDARMITDSTQTQANSSRLVAP